MPRTILVIDDDPAQRLFACATLAEAEFEVVAAESGAAGLALAATRRFDLILLDVQMPGLDGYAVARALRACEVGTARAVILGYSALADADSHRRIREAGMDGRVPKPCTPETLLATVQPWLDDSGPVARLRMEALFGEARFLDLLAGLREQLAEALASEARGGLAERAHRIAGLGGTLGFPELSESWLALSEGDLTQAVPARDAARSAIAAIDGRLDVGVGKT